MHTAPWCVALALRLFRTAPGRSFSGNVWESQLFLERRSRPYIPILFRSNSQKGIGYLKGHVLRAVSSQILLQLEHPYPVGQSRRRHKPASP